MQVRHLLPLQLRPNLYQFAFSVETKGEGSGELVFLGRVFIAFINAFFMQNERIAIINITRLTVSL